MNTPLVRVDGLTVATVKQPRPVIEGIGFELGAGEILGVVGESGSGKSVTCKTVLGILPQQLRVTGGVVELNGQDVLEYGYHQWRPLRGRVISAVFQDPGSYLNPTMPVGRQLQETLRLQHGITRRDARQRAEALLAELGLEPGAVGGKVPRELSGGMLQRTVIAIALAGEPSLLVADEVTTALDVSVQAQVLDVLRSRRDKTGLSIVFVSHDLAVVGSICDKIIVMRDGHIVESGDARSVLTAPQHEYTRLLAEEHERYGIEKFTTAEEARYVSTVA
ncbi:ABC transporter ATP-binding protein [Mycobacterium sp. C31M]